MFFDSKELAGKQSEERGMSITDYMEYLVRKDGNNMMYIYNTEEMENDLQRGVIQMMVELDILNGFTGKV